MEKPAKKLKIDGDLSTNPFSKLHEDIHPLVLQHFTGKEVLNLFTVSPKCYQLVSESSAALKKIELRFYEFSAGDPSPKEVTILLNSNRKYQNVQANFFFLSNAIRKLLLLERFSQSLVSLDISVKEELVSKLPLNLSFPKLKSLDVAASSQINLKLLQASPRLEELSIATKIMDEEVVACLMEMETLKILTLHGDRDDLFAKHSMENAKFKLRALAIEKEKDVFRRTHQSRINFDLFVQQSADTIKSLKLHFGFCDDINLAFNNLPVLEKLCIKRTTSLLEDTNKLQLKPNGTIKSFKFFAINDVPELKCLENLTNLEILTIAYISAAQFKLIVLNMPTLKELRISVWFPRMYGTLKDAQKYYRQMKKSELPINRNIDIVKY